MWCFCIENQIFMTQLEQCSRTFVLHGQIILFEMIFLCVWQIYHDTADFCHAALYVISGQRQRTRGHTQILQLVLLVHQLRRYPISGRCGLHPAKYQLSHWLHHSDSVPRGVLPGLSTRPNCVHHQGCWWQRLHRYVQDPELCLLFSKTQGTEPAPVGFMWDLCVSQFKVHFMYW